MTKDDPIPAVGCHCYAGGFTIGMRQAGFKVDHHLETSRFGADTVEHNMGINVHVGVEEWPLSDLDARVVYSNPPCAPWSGANTNATGRMDERVGDVTSSFDAFVAMDADVWVWESVQGVATRGWSFVEEWSRRCMALGLDVDMILFNNARVGVPHWRKRFFFVASRYQLKWLYDREVQPRKVGEVLDDLDEEPEDRELTPTSDLWVDAWHEADQGERLRHGYDRLLIKEYGSMDLWPRNDNGSVKGRPGFLYHKLDMDKPATTVMGGPTLYHPTEPRRLSVRETQVIAGYPAPYQFVGNVGEKYAQIGKAVMPPAGKWVGSTIMRALQNARPARPRVKLFDLEKGSTQLSLF